MHLNRRSVRSKNAVLSILIIALGPCAGYLIKRISATRHIHVSPTGGLKGGGEAEPPIFVFGASKKSTQRFSPLFPPVRKHATVCAIHFSLAVGRAALSAQHTTAPGV
jgi:hypothetical protein